ncbi:hypothetical protein DCAR_0101738 [Daucus carota subsp. sativus]|uniref:Uncharacterized protein n=1 Tax=Daucus carota subsp. sativus TaxID=79200 RepID=A0A166GLU6_DAUCS|nr:hypothetical protein DCAR_0101738 [Daucus carota subsp. sativus]
MAKQYQPKDKQASLWEKCVDDSDDDNISLDIVMANPLGDGPTVKDEEIFTQGTGIHEEE